MEPSRACTRTPIHEAPMNPLVLPVHDYLNYEEAADYLNVAVGTLYAWVSQKRIPHVRLSGRLVRFRRAEFETWLEAEVRGRPGRCRMRPQIYREPGTNLAPRPRQAYWIPAIGQAPDIDGQGLPGYTRLFPNTSKPSVAGSSPAGGAGFQGRESPCRNYEMAGRVRVGPRFQLLQSCGDALHEVRLEPRRSPLGISKDRSIGVEVQALPRCEGRGERVFPQDPRRSRVRPSSRRRSPTRSRGSATVESGWGRRRALREPPAPVRGATRPRPQAAACMKHEAKREPNVSRVEPRTKVGGPRRLSQAASGAPQGPHGLRDASRRGARPR